MCQLFHTIYIVSFVGLRIAHTPYLLVTQNSYCRYMAEILPIWRQTLSINQYI